MNKFIIIGNGFDLAHGLPTKYSDFAFWFLNNAVINLYESGCKSKTGEYVLDNDVLKITSHYHQLNYKACTSLPSLIKYLNEYGVKTNYKNRFIENIFSFNPQKQWIDIECEYYYNLLRIYSDYSRSNAPAEKKEDIPELKKLNKSFDVIKCDLIKYLKTIDTKKLKPIQEISNHFNGIISDSINAKDKVLILVFNYTNTISIYKDIFDQHELIIKHIHGSLNEIDKNPIIFGYGDEMDIYYKEIERLNDNEFLKNFKSFGYFKTNQYQSVFSFMHSKPYKVYIMGHSCGLSDRVLLNSIFEHKNCNRIKLFYHQIDSDRDDYTEKTMDISRHFKEKNRMRTIISPYTNSIPLRSIGK